MSPLQIADNVWIVDSEAVVTGGLRVPVRMTVIRLSSGALLLTVRYLATPCTSCG